MKFFIFEAVEKVGQDGRLLAYARDRVLMDACDYGRFHIIE